MPDYWKAALGAPGIVGTPAVLGTVVGTQAGGASVVSASHTPNAGELLIALLTSKGNDNPYVDSVAGNGMASGWAADKDWRSYGRLTGLGTNKQNWLEAQVAVAPVGVTAGAVTVDAVTLSGSSAVADSAADAAKALQVLRLTAGACPVRMTGAIVGNTNTATPSVTLKGTEAGSLLLGVVSFRAGTSSAPAGWTANVENTSAGSGGGTTRLSTYTLAGAGGDVTFAPALSGATQWCAMIIEVT